MMPCRIGTVIAILLGCQLTWGVAPHLQGADSVPVTIAPQSGTLRGALDRVQIAVTGRDPRGRSIDLTRQATYESLAPDIVQVSATGLATPLHDGSAAIRVRVGQSVLEVPFQVTEVATRPVSFVNDVQAVLNRTGCSGGSCHAAQYGQGGLKLSLLGFAPDEDYPQLAKHDFQRRVSVARPADSLLLLKATMAQSHGGGRRFRADSEEYRVLYSWIAAGAPGPLKQERTVVDLEITPEQRVFAAGETQQLRVIAVYSDGQRQDVTHRAMYDSLSDAVASVSPSGLITSEGPGQAAIMVRYLGQAKASLAITPFREAVPLGDFVAANAIDELVKKRWLQFGLDPSPLTTDSEFVRRAYLDAIGTLPTPQQALAFQDDRHPQKRERLIDELLGLTGDPSRDIHGEAFSAYWALKWGDLIRNNRNDLGDGGMWALYNWTRQALRENKPLDQFVRELITAQGSVYEVGPANYYKITTKPDELAEAMAQSFLGVRLTCAKCHHHPFEVYSQDDFYGLAAFFTRVATKGTTDFGALGQDTVVLVKRTGTIRHPRTNQVMQPTPLLGKPLSADAHADLRRPLAEWLTARENRQFARNLANRFWAYLMGSGLVEPIDDMRATNPPTNPELLDALAEKLGQSGFDLKQLLRFIMTSRTYQLSSQPTRTNAADTRFYTHYQVKRLPAEVLLDAIDSATMSQERFAGIPVGTRAIELPDPNYVSYFLDTLGRPKRVIVCECERTSQPNLAQVLHVANGDVLSRKVTDPAGRVTRLLNAGFPNEVAIPELYLATLSRLPTSAELNRAADVIASAPQRREGLEDLLWALCNSREFLFNH